MTIWRKSTHGKYCFPWVTMGLTGLCLGLYVHFGGAPDMLVYDRAEIQNGQWWRLATGHLVHLDLHHLVFNIGALLALGILYETASFGGSGKLALGVFGLGGARFLGEFLVDVIHISYSGLILNMLEAAVPVTVVPDDATTYCAYTITFIAHIVCSLDKLSGEGVRTC